MSGVLEGKTALVTGASRGIGRAIAERLARDGALVAVHYSANRAAADDTVQAIRSAGGEAVAVGTDLGMAAKIGDLFEHLDEVLEERTGETALDILISNAGIGGGGGFEDVTEAQFDRVFNLNVKGFVFLVQHAIPRLRDGGRIVSISSLAARGAQAPRAIYAASKQALNSLTLSLAGHLGPRRITVNAISPGAVDTDFIQAIKQDEDMMKWVLSSIAFGRLGQPGDISDAVALLVSPDAHWITGQIIEATGGARL